MFNGSIWLVQGHWNREITAANRSLQESVLARDQEIKEQTSLIEAQRVQIQEFESHFS
jgi:hypothetical protein